MTHNDIDSIIQGIELFCIGPETPEDPEVREAWQPCIDKLKALKRLAASWRSNADARDARKTKIDQVAAAIYRFCADELDS